MTTPDWRELTAAGAATPPHAEPLSRSEGDLNRNSYRPSKFPRLAARAVVNDDGTPIGTDTEAKLAQLLLVAERIEALLIRLLAK